MLDKISKVLRNDEWELKAGDLGWRGGGVGERERREKSKIICLEHSNFFVPFTHTHSVNLLVHETVPHSVELSYALSLYQAFLFSIIYLQPLLTSRNVIFQKCLFTQGTKSSGTVSLRETAHITAVTINGSRIV